MCLLYYFIQVFHSVIVTEDQQIEPKTEKRIQCALQEELEDGTVVLFEPSEEFLESVPITIAGVIDEVRCKAVTTQIIDPTSDTVEMKTGTVIGHIDTVKADTQHKIEQEPPRPRTLPEWLKKIEIGKEGFSQAEQKAITELLLQYESVFSQNEYDLGRTSLIEHAIEIVGDKPKQCGLRPLNPATRQELEKQMNELLKTT
jgi:hypothetical protein